jgi:poly(hydroxyalkanoate) depolymerase family esterase
VPADSSAATAAADRFERRSYRGAAGTLDYQLFIPAAATAGMPLVVMLHGCSQSPKDFARGTRMNALAAEFGFLVAYPGQTSAANGQRCWNWFKPGDQQRDRGEPALIAGVTQDVIAHEAVDPARVYIAGLSAGGAAAAILAATYPELYAAVGIHSGVAYGAATDLSGALVAMHNGGGASQRAAATSFVPVITFHGDRDPTVHEKNSRNIIAAASTAAGVTLETVTTEGISAGGRGFTNAMSADVAGRILIEQWTVHGAGHAWAGGDASASYTDAKGPDASREMLRFFMTHRLNASYG